MVDQTTPRRAPVGPLGNLAVDSDVSRQAHLRRRRQGLHRRHDPDREAPEDQERGPRVPRRARLRPRRSPWGSPESRAVTLSGATGRSRRRRGVDHDPRDDEPRSGRFEAQGTVEADVSVSIPKSRIRRKRRAHPRLVRDWLRRDRATRTSTRYDGRPNPSASAGMPYGTITPRRSSLSPAPAAGGVKRGRWPIASIYYDFDARVHAVQRERGQYGLLAVDVDSNNLALDDVRRAAESVVGAAHTRSTRRAGRRPTTASGASSSTSPA